jgi:hypothetical protein
VVLAGSGFFENGGLCRMEQNLEIREFSFQQDLKFSRFIIFSTAYSSHSKLWVDLTFLDS